MSKQISDSKKIRSCFCARRDHADSVVGKGTIDGVMVVVAVQVIVPVVVNVPSVTLQLLCIIATITCAVLLELWQQSEKLLGRWRHASARTGFLVHGRGLAHSGPCSLP